MGFTRQGIFSKESLMLVLSRQKDEIIMIGDEVEITVVAIKSRKTVVLGVKAPPNIPVHRKEVYDLRRKKHFRV